MLQLTVLNLKIQFFKHCVFIEKWQIKLLFRLEFTCHFF